LDHAKSKLFNKNKYLDCARREASQDIWSAFCDCVAETAAALGGMAKAGSLNIVGMEAGFSSGGA
jgi:hypothetical protein